MYEAFFSTKVDGLGIGLSPVPLDHREPPRPDQGGQPLQWRHPVGCRFTFTLPVEPHPDTQPSPRGRHCMSLIPKKGTVYVVDDDEAVRDSLQWLLEGKDYRVKCFDSAESFLVPLRSARGRLPDRRHPHGRHERPRAAGPPARAPLAAAGHLHHRPRRRADGGDDDEEGRRGLHREAVQGRRAGRPGREDARARPRRLLASTRKRPAATRCCRA